MLLWAKSNKEKILTTSRENFANQGDPNSIIAAKFYKLLSSWTNWEYYSSWSNILILVHRYIFVIWKKI